jgi:uncharacterized protein (TIGR00725 family)
MLKKTDKKIKRVAFFGDASAKENDQHYIDAFKTAKLVAESGYIMVNGGGTGVMRAATLGAKAGGGKVEIVIVNPNKKINNYEGLDEKNGEVSDKIIKTKDYPSRLNKLIELADAFVIFKGGVGTLSEVGLTWEMAKFEYGKHEPLLFFGNEWKEIVEKIICGLDFDPIEKKVFQLVSNKEEVVDTLNKRKGLKKVEEESVFGRIKDWLK